MPGWLSTPTSWMPAACSGTASRPVPIPRYRTGGLACCARSFHGQRSVASGRPAYSSANPGSGANGSSRTIVMLPGRPPARALGDGLIRDIERLVDDGEAFGELLFVDAQRRIRHDRVPANEGVKAVVA